jgi:hypothetical protein
MQFLRIDSIHRWTDGDYSVTTERARVDVETVHRFLSEESYWAEGCSREYVEHVVAASRCYSLMHEPAAAQVGFARVVTDGAWFAWIGDVFVLPEHRGGHGKFLFRCVMDDLEPVRRVTLETRDAHGLYRQFGFAAPNRPETKMERLLDHNPSS